MWYVTNQKHGVSALGVQRILGLGSYQTAWTWLHKLRRAMVRPGRDLLSGEVEVDETYLGGREVGVTGRKTNKKSIVAIAAEIRGCGTGRIRMARVKDASGESLVPFVQTAVCPGTTIRTDGWRAYNGLAGRASNTSRRTFPPAATQPTIVMPRVHRVAGLLDRWWLGIHHGAISAFPARLLSRRVHVPLQPPPNSSSWPPVLPTPSASGATGTRAIQDAGGW